MLHACFDQQGAAAISIVETGKLYSMMTSDDEYDNTTMDVNSKHGSSGFWASASRARSRPESVTVHDGGPGENRKLVPARASPASRTVPREETYFIWGVIGIGEGGCYYAEGLGGNFICF